MNLSLREQLFAVKNSMQKQLNFSGSSNRNNALSPRVAGSINTIENKSPTILEGPTQLSSKMGANSQTTQASSKM
jgi:hypothetical protein